eukprot:11607464-Alexandrium_andersonii.AAC.1
MDEAADRRAEAASAVAVGLPVEGWLVEALVAPVVKMLDRARQSTDVSFIRSAVEAVQLSSLPIDTWTDVVAMLSVLEKEAGHSFGAGRPSGEDPSSTGASSSGA